MNKYRLLIALAGFFIFSCQLREVGPKAKSKPADNGLAPVTHPLPGNTPPTALAPGETSSLDAPPVVPASENPTDKLLGYSVAGVAINSLTWNAKAGPPIILICGFHGDERLAHKFCNKVIEEIKNDPSKLNGRHFIAIPLLNPDGLQKGTRGNQHGVDLNRNFPDNWEPSSRNRRYNPGPAKLSEPESQILAKLIEEAKPNLIITLHQPLRMVNYDGPSPAAEIAREMGRHNGYRVSGNIGYPTPGSFGTFAGVASHKIPTITLELPAGSNLDAVWKPNYSAVMAAINFSDSSTSADRPKVNSP